MAKDTHPKDYKVPNFGVDKDIESTQKNIADAEKKLGHKWVASKDKGFPTASAVQKSSNSVPACTSLGCKTDTVAPGAKDTHPKDYPVPNFGLDKDIVDTQKHIKDTEDKLGHVWEHKKDKPVPTATALNTAADVHLESDPICNSSGCTQYLHP